MKRLFFLITCIVYSFGAVAQQTALNEAVSAEIPNGAEKITKEQALAHASKKFNNDKLLLRSISDRTTKHIYKIDEILVSLTAFDTTLKVKEDFLQYIKRGFDEMNKSNSTYTSSIKKVNNNSIFIMNYIAGEADYYRFVCYNASNTKEMTGVLEFGEADKNEATAILNHIIQSIKFKD